MADEGFERLEGIFSMTSEYINPINKLISRHGNDILKIQIFKLPLHTNEEKICM